jgi:hypothetical protein
LGGLHYAEDALVEAPDTPADLPDLTEHEAMSWDYELLGLSPGDHPLRLPVMDLRMTPTRVSSNAVSRMVRRCGRKSSPAWRSARACWFLTIPRSTSRMPRDGLGHAGIGQASTAPWCKAST